MPTHITEQRRICVVGAGTRFLSGISYYTLRLTNSLARTHQVSAILMRQLLPSRLYPGREHVGVQLTRQEYDPSVRVFDGVDWYWLPSLIGAILFLIRERPHVVVFQWWTGTVLHSYLALAVVARLLGARIVIEFHEVLDTGEARLAPVQAYVRRVLPALMRLASGFVVHSRYDWKLLEEHYGFGRQSVALIPLGPFDHYQAAPKALIGREAPASCCNLLYFGVIRPFKGLEDLVRAFDAIPEDEIENYWLTVVGEPWEGWTLPLDLIAQSRYRNRITLINRYVRDEEAAAVLDGADAVVLPYHRSSASGPLQVAMAHGLPVVVTRVGGLIEAVSGYEGAILVPPQDPVSLRRALAKVAHLRGQRFANPHSWADRVARFDALFTSLSVRAGLMKPRST